ncbi:MAG: RidA family protein [Cyclobacteriaceae bacterium]|nr:RidA family protein [Cyclobacteriaceae bacterium]
MKTQFPFFAIMLMMLLSCQSKLERSTSADKVKFFGKSTSRISDGVYIPEGKALYIISGIVADPASPDAEKNTAAYMGDTKTQAISILEKISGQLSDAGLTLRDVVSMRVYVAPDPYRDGLYDFKGWNEAYDQYFNNSENTVKVARATIGVPTLVNSNFLIEIEGIAVYP